VRNPGQKSPRLEVRCTGSTSSPRSGPRCPSRACRRIRPSRRCRLEALGEPGNDERIHCTFPKPHPDGQTTLTRTPPELLDRIAALVSPPRRHRHHYHGVFALHSPLRKAVSACAGKSAPGSTGVSATGEGT
jgi:hypothetical protein